MNRITRTGIALLLVLSLIVPALAAEKGAAGLTSDSQQNRELRKEIIQIKYLSTNWAGNLVRQFLSPWGKMSQLPRDNRIVIEDTPESIEKILSIIKEMDVKPVELQFNVDLVQGSMSEEVLTEEDKKLRSDPVVKELASMLKYRTFKMMDSSLIKVQDKTSSSQKMGGGGWSFRLRLEPQYIKEDKNATFRVELRLDRIRGFQEGKELFSNLITTTLTLINGQRQVVGVSKLDGGDKALILIVSGKVL